MKLLLKKMLLVLSLSVLSACGTVPTVVKFPTPPATLMQPPAEAGQLKAHAKLSDVESQHEKEAEASLINKKRLLAWQRWAKEQGLIK